MPTYTYQQKMEFLAKLYCPARKASFQTGLSWRTLMAQAMLETGSGEKVLLGTNNIFNIKANRSWTGAKSQHLVPEFVIENGRKVKKMVNDWFRNYDSYEDSLIDRVQFILNDKNYKIMKNPEILGNFEKEVQALQDCGYATDSDALTGEKIYAKKLKEMFYCPLMRKSIALAESNGYCTIVNVVVLEESGDKYSNKEIEISIDGEAYLKKNTTSEGIVAGMVVKLQGSISFKKNNIVVLARIPEVKGTINIKVQQSATVIADKLEEHQGIPSANNSQQQEGSVTSSSLPAPTTPMISQSNDINFKIKIIEGDTSRAIPDFKYVIRYKDNLKEHMLNDQGEEQITAERGQKLEIFVGSANGDFSQKIAEFTVNNEQTQVVKLPLVKIRIKLLNHDQSEVMSNYRVISHYRGQQKAKVTDANGLIFLIGLAGIKIKLTLPQGNVVVPNKVLDSKILEYTYLIKEKYERQDAVTASIDKKIMPTTEEQSRAETKTEPQRVSENKTAPISQNDIRGGNGHPIKMINRDGEFEVHTINKKTNELESGISYVLEYDSKKRNHSSGQDGKGIKKHKGLIGKSVNIYSLVSGTQMKQGSLVITDSKQILVLKTDKPLLEVSGGHWHSRFLSSTNLDDLVDPFKSNAKKFITALKDAGIGVTLSTTFRPVERSYLMYYSTAIMRKQINPDKVPPWAGVNIDWTHGGNYQAAIAGATEMHRHYKIGRNPVGKPEGSNHNNRMAVDMTLTGISNKKVVIDGVSTKVSSISDLAKLGQKIGVIWFGKGDVPHWSHTGR